MKSAVKNRLFKITLIPFLGLVVSITLKLMTGLSYTTPMPQTSLTFYSKYAAIWSLCSIFIGIYLYSKCHSMNHLKFSLGMLSVITGASLPWIFIGI